MTDLTQSSVGVAVGTKRSVAGMTREQRAAHERLSALPRRVVLIKQLEIEQQRAALLQARGQGVSTRMVRGEAFRNNEMPALLSGSRPRRVR